MKHFFISLLLLSIIVTGCSAPVKPNYYNLSTMPSYDANKIDEEYKDITEVKNIHVKLTEKLLKLESAGAKMTSKQIEIIFNVADTYLYWISVSTVQLYHQDFDASHRSLAKAFKSLKELYSVLIEIERDSSL